MSSSSASPDDELDRLVRSGLTRQQVEAGEDCLDPEVLASYADEGLTADERERATAHLAVCGTCRQALALERAAAPVTVPDLRAVAAGDAPAVAPRQSGPLVRTWLPLAATLFVTVGLWLAFGPDRREPASGGDGSPASVQARRESPVRPEPPVQRESPAPERGAAGPKAEKSKVVRPEQPGSPDAPKEQTEESRDRAARPSDSPQPLPPPSQPAAGESQVMDRSSAVPRPNQQAGQRAAFKAQDTANPADPANAADATKGPTAANPANAAEAATDARQAANATPSRPVPPAAQPPAASPRTGLVTSPPPAVTSAAPAPAAPPPATAAPAPASASRAATAKEPPRAGGAAAGTAAPAAAGGAVAGASADSIHEKVASPAAIAPFARVWRVAPPGGIDVSADGGTTWTTEYSRADQRRIAAVAASSAGQAWAVGAGGLVMRRADDRSWRDVSRPTTRDLVRVAVMDRLRADVVDDQGHAYRTTDGGRSWHSPERAR